MTKTTAALLFLFLIAALFLASNLGYFETLINILNPNSEPTKTKPGLYMQVTSHLENWIEISINNSAAEYVITIKVRNIGVAESTAATVNFEIRNETQIVTNGAIEIGIINEDQEKNVTQRYQFEEGTYEATFTLSTSSTVWDTITNHFKVGVPREGLGDHVRFYITPNDPSVQAHLLTIGKDLNTIYGWVGDNIRYEFDSDIHGKEEYWQFPHETLDLKTGDCEDQAFLLCSLIRASGVEAEDIFVALGTVDYEGHAWVIIRTPIGWRTLEPTTEGIVDRILTDIFEFLNTEGRNYYFASNDIYFEEINPKNNRSFLNQEFTGWYTGNLKLDGARVTINIDQAVTLKITVTNTGNYTYLGFIQIKIQKDIVMGPDTTFVTQSYPLTLNTNSSTQLELTFAPNEVTEDTFLKCRQYYYQVSTCFSRIHNPDDANTRECIFTTS
jgi:predicted transglutaminase-like cysteine proteinase